MANLSRETKKHLGAMLLKLKRQDGGLTPDEWQYVGVLEIRGLVKIQSPDVRSEVVHIDEAQQKGQEEDQSTVELTRAGEALLLTYTDRQLLEGRFLLPGEVEWYDGWPWKLVWPALVSVATTLVLHLLWYLF